MTPYWFSRWERGKWWVWINGPKTNFRLGSVERTRPDDPIEGWRGFCWAVRCGATGIGRTRHEAVEQLLQHDAIEHAP